MKDKELEKIILQLQKRLKVLNDQLSISSHVRDIYYYKGRIFEVENILEDLIKL